MLGGNDPYLGLIVENSWDAVTLLAEDATICYANPAATQVWGYASEELVGRDASELIHSDDLPRVAALFDQLVREPHSRVRMEYRCRHKEGSWRWMEGYCINLLHEPGVRAIVTWNREITDRSRAEPVLRKREAAERWFSEQLTALHEVSNELSKAASLGELCRSAVELGRSRLGFDRMGIWFVGEDRTWAMGSFGVDESGEIRDERGSRVTVSPRSVAGQILSSRKAFVIKEDAAALDNQAEVVGRATHAMAGLWNGEEVIGFVSTDNLLRRQPITERQCRLLTLYASALGHLCTLKRTEEALRDSEQRLEQDVAERKRLEEELRRRMDALAEADRRKDDFLAMLSHELRNPLGAISNSLYVMQLPETGGAAQQRALEVLKRQVQQQVRLVDELLDVSRITRGLVELRKVRLDLAGLIRESVEDYRIAAEQARLALHLELPEARVWVRGDPARLAQVIGNLLSNAIKFTDAGGSVTLHLEVVGAKDTLTTETRRHGERQRERDAWISGDESEREGKLSPTCPSPIPSVSPCLRGESRWAVLTIRDTGIGMSPELLASVFDSFIQGDRSLDRSRGGLGLGLALVKGLAALHGGEVDAHSDGPGRGSAFTVRLPLEATPDASPVAHGETVKDEGGLPEARVRVLVVDDNHDGAETLREIVELWGHQVEVAYSGAAGLEAARRFRPDVVLCDIGLPEMDGFAVAEALRHDATTASACLIAVTGYGQEEDRRRSLAAGFDHHLVKPIEPAELQRLLGERVPRERDL